MPASEQSDDSLTNALLRFEADPADSDPQLAYWLNRFEYHTPHGDQADRYGRLRAAGRAMAELILELTPESSERTRALETLQHTIMLANAAIACNERPAA